MVVVVVVPLNYWKGSGTIEILFLGVIKFGSLNFRAPECLGEREFCLVANHFLSTRRFNPF